MAVLEGKGLALRRHRHGRRQYSGPLPEYLRSEGTIQALHGLIIDPTFAENVKAGDMMVSGKASAAAPRANMRLSPSKQAVYPSSLHRLLPVSIIQKRHQCRSAASGDRR